MDSGRGGCALSVYMYQAWSHTVQGVSKVKLSKMHPNTDPLGISCLDGAHVLAQFLKLCLISWDTG